MRTSIPIHSPALPPDIVTLLESGEKAIRQSWHKALGGRWGTEAFEKWKRREEAGEVADLPSIFLSLLAFDRPIAVGDIDALLRKLRLQTYFFSDFFAELTCLESAMVNYLRGAGELETTNLLDVSSLIRKKSSELVEKIIRETSDLYEQVIENGLKGFCRLDGEGRIVTHNEQMVGLLGEPDIEGKRLEDFLGNDDEKAFIRRAVESGPGKKPVSRKLYLTAREAEDPIPVGAEVSPMSFGAERRGACVCITDISQPERQMLRVFDRSTLGILKAGLSGQITYANDVFLRILGIKAWKGKTIQELLGEGEAWAKVKKGLKRRERGLSDEYRVEITRGGSVKVPVWISAAPETDLTGRPTGTMAIIRDMLREETVAAIHKHIERERDWKILLDKVATEVQRVVPYDLGFFTRYSEDGMHSCELTHHPRTESLKWRRRWWEISPAARNFLNHKKPVGGDLDEFLAKDEWRDLTKDREFQRLLETGVQSFLFLPVLKGGNVAASVTLFSMSKDAFKGEDEEALSALPLDSALHMALYYQDRQEMIFRLNLTSLLSSVSEDIKSLAALLVKKIGKHYEWDNVSLFRVDEDSKMVVLEKEFARTKSFKLGQGFEQRMGNGVLGHVIDTGECMCIPDVDAREFRGVCVKALERTKSEFCLPIVISGHVRWLLNIEDSHQNAFSSENEAALKEIVRELVGLMTRLRNQQIMRELLENASDGILTTDGKGKAAKVNPAWARLLGYPQSRIKGRDVIDFFADREQGLTLLQVGRVPNRKVRLRRGDGELVEVLLSVSRLSKELAGRVLIAKDLALAKRTEELDYLEKMYYEIATQTKTPLSLAFTWLHRLKEETGAEADTIDKILKQLRRVDLTFDRLALYSRKEERVPARHFLLDMDEVATKVMEEIPEIDRKQIVRDAADPLPLIRGDLYQLFFCFQSILSFLLRFLPHEERIHWKIRQENGMIVSEISGYFPAQTDQKPADLDRVYRVSKTLTDMATGKALVKRFIEQHGGRLHDPKIVGDTMSLRVELPAAEDQ